MGRSVAILIIFSAVYSMNEKIDIKSSTIQELGTLPISIEKIISIKQYLEVQDIEWIKKVTDDFFTSKKLV